MDEDMPRGKKTVKDEQIIEFVRSQDAPFVFADEVAQHFDLTRQWAHKRLGALLEEGRIQRKHSGNNSVIWYPEDY